MLTDCPLGDAHEETEKARDRQQVTAYPGLPTPRPGPLLHQSPSHLTLGQARLWASPQGKSCPRHQLWGSGLQVARHLRDGTLPVQVSVQAPFFYPRGICAVRARTLPGLCPDPQRLPGIVPEEGVLTAGVFSLVP